MKRRYYYSIQLDPIDANSEEEALKLAYKDLENLAQCNDGSEFLANAQPVYNKEEIL